MSTKDTSVDIKQTGKDSSQCENIVNNKKVLLVLDSSVLLKAIGYDEEISWIGKVEWCNEQRDSVLSTYLRRNKNMVRIPELVRDEVTSKIKRYKDHHKSRVELCKGWNAELSLYYDCVKNIEYSKKQLDDVEEAYAFSNMSEELKNKWIEKKKYEHDLDQSKEDLLIKIHANAKKDRRIIACALAFAEKNYVCLIADDQDFLLFSEKIAMLGNIRIIDSKKLIFKEEKRIRKEKEENMSTEEKEMIRKEEEERIRERKEERIRRRKGWIREEEERIRKKIEVVIKEYVKTHILNSREMSQDEEEEISDCLQFDIYEQFLEVEGASSINMNKQFTIQAKSLKKSREKFISNAKIIFENEGEQKLFEYLVKESKKELISNAEIILKKSRNSMHELLEYLAKESELKYIIYFGNMEKFIEEIYPADKSVALIRWKDIKKKFETNH